MRNIFYWMRHSAVMLGALLLCACSEEKGEDKPLIPVETVLQDGMIKLTDGIGEWEQAVIYEKDGYVLYQEAVEEEADYVQFVSPDDSYDCCIYADRNSHLPEALAFADERFYFENQADTAIIVSHTADDGMERLDSIPFRFASAQSKADPTTIIISYQSTDDRIQRVIKALDAVLASGDHYTSAQVKKLKKALDSISMFYYYDNVESIIDELDLCREEYGETGKEVAYCFAQYATKKRLILTVDVKYAITVRTELGAREVYCNSAVVAGSINCMDKSFREKGQWGIVYSKVREGLTLDNCEGVVYANRNGSKNFSLELTDLEKNTTYYYKTFYQFDADDHGDLVFGYGKRDAKYYVDSDSRAGSFTTREVTIELVSLYNSSLVEHHYDPEWQYGSFYPYIKFRVTGAKSIADCGVQIKGELNGWDDYVLEGHSIDLPGGEIWYDKWGFTGPISGRDYLKLWVTTPAHNGRMERIETDWIPFTCNYQSGVALL